MTKGLRRYYGRGHLHFITFSCYRRLPLLGSVRSRNVFVKILGEVRDRYGFRLIGYVVMPEHVHLLIGEPKTGTPSTVPQVLKQRVSGRLRGHPRHRRSSAQLRFRFDEEGAPLLRFWQRRFHDFNVWSHKKKIEKLGYILNLVKRGFVSHPQSWPWSSFSFYRTGAAGLVPIDPTA